MTICNAKPYQRAKHMKLELKRQRDGIRLRPYWYGRFEVDGKRRSVTLGKFTGKPPESLSLADFGDPAFEKSRADALTELKIRAKEAGEKREASHWVKRLHEIQYGETIKGALVIDLIQAWERMPKKKLRAELHPRYVIDLHATLRRFVDFVQAKHPNMKDVGQIPPVVAGEFIKEEESRGLSAKARNDSVKRLRAVFRSLMNEGFVSRNPFDGIPLHTENHVHRRPLTPEEIAKLLKAVESDDFTRPLFVCALSTAMRRGDCCCLKWTDVHFNEKDATGNPLLDYVTVKTSKTGETVTAPIDERLKSELIRAKTKARKKSPYVWPAQAKMYAVNQQGVTRRIGQAFDRAGLIDEEIPSEQKRGIRRASIVDFHSLRTTWITDKLAAGIPIEAVKRTSGHRTTDVVTEHYYKPGEQQHLKTLNSIVPQTVSRDDKLRVIIQRMVPKTIKRDKVRLLEILDGKGETSSARVGGD